MSRLLAVIPVFLICVGTLPGVLQTAPVNSPPPHNELAIAVNNYRSSQGWDVLLVSPALTKAAQAHADDMAKHQFLDHKGSDGSTLDQRVTRTKFNWTEVTENLAPVGNAKEAVRLWAKSDKHNANMLGSHLFIGAATSGKYACAIFARGSETPPAKEAPAATTMRRNFTVSADGKVIGNYVQEITTQGEYTHVNTHSDASVRVLFISYNYHYEGKEDWLKHGDGYLLQSLQDDCQDDKNRRVNTFNAYGTLFTSNGQQTTVPADVISSSYWHIPPPAKLNVLIPFLDLSSGNYLQATFREIGKDNFGTHYQILGPNMLPVEVWFDADGLLTRRVMSRRGRTAVANLSSVERP